MRAVLICLCALLAVPQARANSDAVVDTTVDRISKQILTGSTRTGLGNGLRQFVMNLIESISMLKVVPVLFAFLPVTVKRTVLSPAVPLVHGTPASA